MVACQTDLRSGWARRPSSPWRTLLLCTCAAALLLTPGCSGCRWWKSKTPEELEEEEKERLARLDEEKKKRKDPFEGGRLLSLPNEGRLTDFWCKPGHWNSLMVQGAKANEADFDGELELGLVDVNGSPVGLPGMPYTLTGFRPAVLPKGTAKDLSPIALFIPSTMKEGWIGARIADRRSGRSAIESKIPVGSAQNRMAAYQYHLIVLARLTGSYGYIKDLVSIKNPAALAWKNPDREYANRDYYRVTYLAGDKAMPLPRYGLFWTSIGYVFWDDADPTMLLSEQKVALLDWLHWGGQLIISGPDSLDALRGSFLEPYLPAKSSGARKLAKEDLAALSERWTMPVRGRPSPPILPVQPLAGVKLEKHAEARYVPGTGDLVAERRVGRGRILVSAFPLTARELVNWPGFDSFFNGCLLGRPPRGFYEAETELRVAWIDRAWPQSFPRSRPNIRQIGGLSIGDALDPSEVCKLRYFSRDAGRELEPITPNIPSRNPFAMPSGATDEELGLEPKVNYPDVGSWSDFNAVAREARSALQGAARIEVPDPIFVIKIVAGYLVVLVPLNWLFFRTIGRVEWAWAAAPLIAIACTVVVIRMARLDIGFARSATEVSVIELQGDYQRAHVTRYSALYTSLFTRYNVSFPDDPGAQVMPFPTVNSLGAFRMSVGQTHTPLKFLHEHGTEVEMEGFSVASNSTSFLHSEQMADLGGPIALTQSPDGEYLITNRTEHTLRGIGLMKRGPDARGSTARPLQPGRGAETLPWGVEAAWIGTLQPGATAPARFQPVSSEEFKVLWDAEREESPQTMAQAPEGEVSLRGLLKAAQSGVDLEPDEVRLIGWLNEEIPGQVIQPAAPQVRRGALVVAHLRYGQAPDPVPDANLPEAVEEQAALMGP